MGLTKQPKWVFRLYIAGDAPNSRMAMATLTDIRQSYDLDQYELEIIDILKDPLVAIRDGILITPTLVRLWPEPVCKIVGNLSERSIVLQALGLSGAFE
jgi:circadian clock protein KaiB